MSVEYAPISEAVTKDGRRISDLGEYCYVLENTFIRDIFGLKPEKPPVKEVRITGFQWLQDIGWAVSGKIIIQVSNCYCSRRAAIEAWIDLLDYRLKESEKATLELRKFALESLASPTGAPTGAPDAVPSAS